MDRASELINKLGSSDDYFERQKAAWELVELGEPALEALVGALEAGEFSDLRYKSAWVLGKIGDSRAVEPLGMTMLNDFDSVVREYCAAALDAVGSLDAVPFLVKAIGSDPKKDVRLRAVVALRNLGAINALRGLLKSSEPETRGMAITGLEKLKCEETLEEIGCFLKDEDIDVRRRAAAYLGEFPGDKTLQFLSQALKDSQPTVREEVLKSLARVRGVVACQLALSALKDDDILVRLTAVTSLGEIGDDTALQPLMEIMFGQDEEEIRAWAAWSLGEIGDTRAIEPLKAACKMCPYKVMKMATASLIDVFKIEP